MTFTYTYRSSNGSVVSANIESESRRMCFAELHAQGINPLSVKECIARKTASAQNNHSTTSKNLLVVISLIVLIGGMTFLCVNLATDNEQEQQITLNHVAKVPDATVSSGTTTTNIVTSVVTHAQESELKPKARETYRDEKGVLRYKNGGARAFDPTRPRRTIRPEDAGEKRSLFKSRPENEIARLLTLEPGEMMFGIRQYDERFQAEFMKSLEIPIAVNEDDTPYNVQLKQAVVEVKNEIAKRIKNGEKLADILDETRSELQRMAQYKRMLMNQVTELTRDHEMTDKDVNDFISAANTMLKEKGIAPIRGGVILSRGLKLRAHAMRKDYKEANK